MSFKNCKIIGTGADSDAYHAVNAKRPRGESGWIVTSGMLREFANCPSRWLAGYQPPGSDAKDFGSLLDLLVLTPSKFDAKYKVRPAMYQNEKGEEKEWNNNSGVCKAWNAEAKAEGREPLKQAELVEAQAASARLKADAILKAFADASEKQLWVSGEWHDKPTGLVIPVQALIDYVPRADTEFRQSIGDLKTTRSAKPHVWSRYSSQRGYHLQGAFYIEMLNAATGEERDTFCHVLVENFPPFQTGRSMVSLQKLEYGRALYQAHLANYAQCLKSGVWPDYQSGPDVIDGWSVDIASRWDEMEVMAAMGQIAAPADLPPETEEELDLIP